MSLRSNSNHHILQSVNDFDVAVTPSEEMVMTESFEEGNNNNNSINNMNNNNNCSVKGFSDNMDNGDEYDDDDVALTVMENSNDVPRSTHSSSLLQKTTGPAPTPPPAAPAVTATPATTTTTTEQQQIEQQDATLFDFSNALAAEEEEEEIVFEDNDDNQQDNNNINDNLKNSKSNDSQSTHVYGSSSSNDDDEDESSPTDEEPFAQFLPLSLGVDNNLKKNKSNDSQSTHVDGSSSMSSNDDEDESSPPTDEPFVQFLPLSLGVVGGGSRRTTDNNSDNNNNEEEDNDCCNATTSTTESDILSPSDVSSVVDSVLEDLEQQKEARSVANALIQSHYQDRSIIHATDHGVAELLFCLHTYAKDGIVVVNNPNGRDELLQRVQDFHRARFLRREYCTRHEATTKRSFGIYGLFQYVTELFLDLEWTEDATWRRLYLKDPFPWIEFQRVHKRKYRKPYFCYLLLAVWTIMLGLSFAFNEFKVAPMSENPFYGPPVQVLRELGAVDRDLIVEENQWYRLVTSLVLHAGLIHYIINVMLMIFMGSAVEQAHGFDGTVLIFLLSGIGGNIISALFLAQSISVGASGGLFGLLGVCVADICTHWDLVTLKNYRDPNDPAHKGFNYNLILFGIGVQVVLYLVIGLAPIVDNFNTVGGFFYGICLTVPILKWLGDGSGFFSSGNNHTNHATGKMPNGKMPKSWVQEANERNRRQQSACHLFCASVSIFVLVGSTLLLAKGQKGEIACTNCRYFSCAPFPWWNGMNNNNNNTDERWWHCDDCAFAPLETDVLYRGNVTTLVNMTCPNDEVVTIDLFAPNVDKDEIQKDLGGYCRQYCEL